MAGCGLYTEERDPLEEEIWEVKEGGINPFDLLDSRKQTTATDGETDRGQDM